MAGSMRFVIELDNGQYKVASAQVIRDTEKMERATAKSYRKMDNAGNAFFKKFKKYFSFSALFGGVFLLGISALHKFFTAYGKGIQSAIDKNKDLKKEIQELDRISSRTFEEMGKQALPTLTKLYKFMIKIMNPAASVIPLNANEKELRDLKDNIETSMGKLVAKHGSNIRNDPYKNKLGIMSMFQNEYTIREKLLNEVNDRLYDKMGERLEKQDKLQKEKDEIAKKQQEELIKAQNEFNNILKDTTDAISGIVVGTSESGQEFKKVATTASGILSNLMDIGESIEKTGDLTDTLSKIKFADWLSIAISIASVIVSILDNMNKSSVESQLESQRRNDILKIERNINYELEKQADKLEKINFTLEKLRGLLDGQEDAQNQNTESLQEQIDTHEEIIDALNKEKKANDELIKKAGDRTKLGSLQKEARLHKEIIEGLKAAAENQSGAQLETTEKMIEHYETQLRILNAQINLIKEANQAELDNVGIESEIRDEMQAIYELTKEIYTIQIERNEKEKELLKAKSEYATEENQLKYTEEIVDLINRQLSDLQALLLVQTDIDERMQTQIDIQELQNELSQIREETEGKIAEQMEKQINLMKGLVDLGLDLENIRVVKQLSKNFAAQGYSGTELGAKLQEVGVQNRAISGRTLNIYGNINNTLNQASPNVMINSMNDLINKIGGV